MIIGVPQEIKRDEYRVAILPVGVEELTRRGNEVMVQAGEDWDRVSRITNTYAQVPNSSRTLPRSLLGPR